MSLVTRLLEEELWITILTIRFKELVEAMSLLKTALELQIGVEIIETYID